MPATPKVKQEGELPVVSVSEDISAIVIEGEDGVEQTRYTRERHGENFAAHAASFIKKFNEKNGNQKDGYKYPLGPYKVVRHIELIEDGKITMAEYERLSKLGISNPGGYEWGEAFHVRRPLKAISVR